MIQFTNDELRALHHFLQEAIIYTEDGDLVPDVAEEMPKDLEAAFESARAKIRAAVAE
jgi:hypothetical protein